MNLAPLGPHISGITQCVSFVTGWFHQALCPQGPPIPPLFPDSRNLESLRKASHWLKLRLPLLSWKGDRRVPSPPAAPAHLVLTAIQLRVEPSGGGGGGCQRVGVVPRCLSRKAGFVQNPPYSRLVQGFPRWRTACCWWHQTSICYVSNCVDLSVYVREKARHALTL